LVATGPHPARLEARRPDGCGNRSNVEGSAPGDSDFHDVLLDVNVEAFDAIQASQGVFDALGSRESLEAERFDPDSLDAGWRG